MSHQSVSNFMTNACTAMNPLSRRNVEIEQDLGHASTQWHGRGGSVRIQLPSVRINEGYPY